MQYRWTISQESNNQLTEIDMQKRMFDVLPPLNKSTQHFVHESTMKSSLYSAKIEGNPLTETQFSQNEGQGQHLLEVQNLTQAYDQISKMENTITFSQIKKLHAIVMNALSSSTGQFRKEMVAVYNKAGIVEYLAPPWQEIETRITQLLAQIGDSSIHPIVASAVLHFGFEKIHPFMDGNGRAGRMLLNHFLMKNGYPPAIIHRKLRSEYLEHLREADKSDLTKATKEDYSPLVLFIADEMSEYYWNIFL